jgi:hypothetical protein
VREPSAGQQQPAPMPSYVQPQPYQQQQYSPPYGYGPAQGYGHGGTSSWGIRPRRDYPVETKPCIRSCSGTTFQRWVAADPDWTETDQIPIRLTGSFTQ